MKTWRVELTAGEKGLTEAKILWVINAQPDINLANRRKRSIA